MRSRGSALRARKHTVGVVAAIASAAALGGVAACGGEASSAGGAGAIAKYIPAGSPIYFEVSTDLDGSQWKQALTLAKVFPGYPKAAKAFNDELAKNDLVFDRDLKPLLGKSAVIAISDKSSFTDGSDPIVIAAVDIPEGKRADMVALAKKGDDAWTPKGTYKGFDLYDVGDGDLGAVNDDVLLVSSDANETKRAIDASEGDTGDTMAGSDKLSDALAELPDEVMAQGYIDVADIVKKVGAKNAEAAKTVMDAGIGPNASVGLSIAAETDGMRLKMVTRDLGETASAANEEYTPTLIKNVPADALGYLSFRNAYAIGEEAISQASASDPKVKEGIGQARGVLGLLGISTGDLKALTSGEHAVVVTNGKDAPGAVLALEVADGAKAQETLDKLRERGLALAGAAAGSIPPFAKVQLANGVTGWASPVSPNVGIVYGVDGKIAYLGTQAEAITQVQQPSAKLVDDAAYQAATRQMPSKVTALAWVNGEQVLSTLDRMGLLRGAPDETIANLRPLRNLVMWSTGGDRPTAEVFVTIK